MLRAAAAVAKVDTIRRHGSIEKKAFNGAEQPFDPSSKTRLKTACHYDYGV